MGEMNIYHFSFTIVVSLVPIIILVVCDVWVVVIVQKNLRTVYNLQKTRHYEGQSGKDNQLYVTVKKKRCMKQFHLIQVFGALLGSNLLTWLPNIGILLYLLITQPEVESGFNRLLAAFHVIFISQVIAHPLVEVGLVKEVRDPMKEMMRWCLCLRKKRRGSGMSSQEDSEASLFCKNSRFCEHTPCCFGAQ